MPTIREHLTSPFSDIDDDDGMPPLVDNPNPSMTFTFFTDMTPITALSADPTVAFDPVWESPVPSEPTIMDIVYESESLDIQTPFYGGPERTTHSKKRDASYIPRPPNAFILFRSSFIRSQQVPEKVEGNHSTLSKIIGKYWKTLSREEREVWEAKALVAQAEHRKRYPDWRFRPGANALAKLKVKDGPSPNRRRHSQSGRKTRPRGESNANKKSRDERCAVIADLLVEGKTGVDLEHAVKKWEDKNRGEEISADVERSEGHMGEGEHKNEGGILDAVEGGRTQTRSQTPDAVDTRFKIPLTAMFKRSLSAPASQSPENHQQHPLPSHTHTQVRQDSLQSVFANITYDTYDTPYKNIACGGGGDGVDQQHTDHVSPLDSIGDLSPLVPPCLLGEDPPAGWNDPYNLLETSLGAPPPPPSVRTQDCTYAHEHTHAHILSSPVATDPPFSSYDSPGLGDMHSFRPWSYTPVKHWADTCQPFTQMSIFINEFGGYGWGNGDMNGIDGGCDGTVGEGTYGTTPEHSPVEYTHTHTHAHAADEHYDAAELVRVFPGYAPATAKF